MKILYKLASRSRPEKFEQTIKTIEQLSSDKNFIVIASVDTDDLNFNEYVKVICKYNQVILDKGISNNKIHAINRGMKSVSEWDILVNVSDDMKFIYNGFDNQIRNDMMSHFPDLDGMLHYNDGNQGENCMTMSIMGRKYYERDNFIYDPRFESLWSDVVAQEVAQTRGKIKYMGDDKILFRHLHPSFGFVPYDEQSRRTEAMDVRQRDYNTYLEIKKEYDPNNKFPIRGI